MWVGHQGSSAPWCDVPSLVSHTIVVDTERLSPIFLGSHFVHLPVLLLGEFCEECPGHTCRQDIVSLPSSLALASLARELGKMGRASSIDIWGTVAVRRSEMGCEKSGLRQIKSPLR